ncbi:MAG: transposase [Erythrobacter sp.]
MPQLIENDQPGCCSLAQSIEAIGSIGFDPTCPQRLEETAGWLQKLNNNREFLGDLLIEQLKSRHSDDGDESGYGPQAIILSPLRGDVFLRANIWPSEQDQCFKSSGARTFVYGVPHDHNFSFLTSGYFGPGYKSDYYEYDYSEVAGYPGEKPPLRFIERSALSEGKIMLYRAHKDIHSQLPPDSMSVSLNIMHVNQAQSWFDQYGFDLETGEVTKVLSPNSTEVFLRASVATGHADALDLAESFGANHPSDRMRLASFEARANLLEDRSEKDQLWRSAEQAGSEMLCEIARAKREALAAS